MIKYKSLKRDGDFYRLTIEGNINIKNIFILIEGINIIPGLLIIGADSNDNETRHVVGLMLKSKSIDFEIINDYIWVSAPNARRVFDETEFGESFDLCFLLIEKPSTNGSKNWLSKVLRYRDYLLSNYLKNEADIFLLIEGPDLILISKSIDLLKSLEIEVDNSFNS